MDDPYNLERFVAAQDAGATYDRAVAELRRGRKTTHWMWFVFPQLAGLGQSPTSSWFAISSLEEAQAYLRHPVLGPRLRECAGRHGGADLRRDRHPEAALLDDLVPAGRAPRTPL